MSGTAQGPGSAPTRAVEAGRPLLLDTLASVVAACEATPDPARTRAALCCMVATMADAPAAAHIRHDSGHTRMTLWYRRSPEDGVCLDQDEGDRLRPPLTPDWWARSRARPVLVEALGQPHLAELPLSPDTMRPSLLVTGRPTPFSEVDSDLISRAHRPLRVVEQVVEILLDPQVTVRAPPKPPPACPPLTAREREVLVMLSEGLLARSIAQRLDVSERTVHKHLGSLYRKLDAHDRLLAVRRAESLGLLPETIGRRW